jgi:hypothetical protein
VSRARVVHENKPATAFLFKLISRLGALFGVDAPPNPADYRRRGFSFCGGSLKFNGGPRV